MSVDVIIKLLDEVDAAKQEMQLLQEAMEIQEAQIVASAASINTLVGNISPEDRHRIRYRRSRHFDEEMDRLLAAGIVTTDPRKDPQWVEEHKYIPPTR